MEHLRHVETIASIDENVSYAAFVRNGSRVVLFAPKFGVAVFSVPDGRFVGGRESDSDEFKDAVVAPQGDKILIDRHLLSVPGFEPLHPTRARVSHETFGIYFFSPSGQHYVRIERGQEAQILVTGVSASAEPNVASIDVAPLLAPYDSFYAACFSHDGTKLFVMVENRTIAMLDTTHSSAASWTLSRLIDPDREFRELVFDRIHDMQISGNSQILCLVYTHVNDNRRRLHAARVHYLDASRDSFDFNFDFGRQTSTLSYVHTVSMCLAYKGTHLAIAANRGKEEESAIHIFDTKNGNLFASVRTRVHVRALTFSRDASFLYFVTARGTVKRWALNGEFQSALFAALRAPAFDNFIARGGTDALHKTAGFFGGVPR